MTNSIVSPRKALASSKRLVLPIHHGFIFADLHDIVHCEAAGVKSWLYLDEQEKKYLVSRSIGEMEELLCLPNFVRIHNSYIINVNFVVSYTKGDGGTVIMADGAELGISRNHKADFLGSITCV